MTLLNLRSCSLRRRLFGACILLLAAMGPTACGGPPNGETAGRAIHRPSNPAPASAAAPPASTAVEPVPEYPGLRIGGSQAGLFVEEGDGITFGVAPFSLSNHTWITAEIDCSNWLNGAHYRQDVREQTSSWAHFDNCDFTDALAKLQESVKSAKDAAAKQNPKEAIGYLGRALHALQDFYAHTNYVELMEKEHPDDKKAVKPLELWTASGQKKVADLIEGRFDGKVLASGERLVSGVVWWGFPKRCAKGTETHGQLAKDSIDSDNGKVKSPPKWGGTRFHAARDLAQAETIAFLRATLAAWPELQGACGNSVVFAMFLDGRREKKQEP